MTANTDYMLYLVDVACDSPTSHNPVTTPNISTAATFIADTLRTMSAPDILITRTGTNRAADLLFGHPDIQTFFRNLEGTETLRNIIHGEILPAATTVFRDHWNYIIGPAMDEHIAVARLTTP